MSTYEIKTTDGKTAHVVASSRNAAILKMFGVSTPASLVSVTVCKL